MGRKVNYDEKEKKGPGRKSRKQGDPVISAKLKGKYAIEISGVLNRICIPFCKFVAISQ